MFRRTLVATALGPTSISVTGMARAHTGAELVAAAMATLGILMVAGSL